MPHQDHSSGSPAIGPSALGPALDWLVRSELFGSYTLRDDSVFTPATLVRLVLRWAWSEQATLTDSYRVAGYLSVAGVLRVLRKAMRSAAVRLEYALANALVDPYQRQNKASRDYPCKKSNLSGDQPPLIIDANQHLIAIARQIRGFTA